MDDYCENHPLGERHIATRYFMSRGYCDKCFSFLFGGETEFDDDEPTNPCVDPLTFERLRAPGIDALADTTRARG